MPELVRLDEEVLSVKEEWSKEKVSESELNLKVERINQLLAEHNRLLKDFIQRFDIPSESQPPDKSEIMET